MGVRTKVRVHRQAKSGSESESRGRLKVEARVESGSGGQEVGARLKQVRNRVRAGSEKDTGKAEAGWNKYRARLGQG